MSTSTAKNTQTQAQVYRERQMESLRRTLGDDILGFLNDPAIIEIMLNQDGRIWVDVLGGDMEPRSAMDPVRAKMVIETVASMLDTSITKENPIISGELPLDGSRFEAQIPPIVEAPTFAIRKKALLVFTLDDYVDKSIMTERQRDLIIDAVKERKNILVSGGTGCFEKGHPILMLDGSIKPVEQIVVGDKVMGPDGHKRVVKDVHSGIDHMVRVVPHMGSSFVVNQGHSLALVDVRSGRRSRLTVTEWTRESAEFRCRHALYYKNERQNTVGIRDIESLGPGTYYGFEVDHPDHLFVDGNFMVQGNSGKTTMSNAILHAISREAPNHRIMVLEDTRELQCTAPNTVSSRTSDEVDMTRLLKSAMRMRPDRIVVGEVRGKEALDMLDAWNTGHPGGLCTVHANNARAALQRIGLLVQRANVPPCPELIAEAVNIIVSIRRTSTGRIVDEVLAVKGFENGRFLTESL